MIRTPWQSRPTTLRLPAEEQVQVWRVSLPQEGVDPLWNSLLAEEEARRADRFAFEKDRRVYTATRGILRTLLGQYLQIAPQAIRFAYNSFGKPSLDVRHHNLPMRFNVSHSHHYALLAFGAVADLGVDIEHQKYMDIEEVAPTVFSRAECAELRRLPAPERERVFLRLWTHKEALVKAVGWGLSLPVQEIEFAFSPPYPVQLLRGTPEIGEVTDWSLCELTVHPEYAAALAVKTPKVEVQLWDWR